MSLRHPLRWLREEVPQAERIRYRLGCAEPEDTWRRSTRLEVLRESLRRRMPSPEKWLYRSGLRRASGLSLPDALCIGAQKAGTTWLYENLACHPEVFVPPDVKEVHYFDILFRERLADYAAVFADGVGRVKCDITPNYGRLRPSRIRFVRHVMPDVRLIFLMRNPIERAWSQALMDLTARSGRRYEDVPDADFEAHFRSRARGNGLYSRILAQWEAAFGEECLFVGFFEDVSERPRELLTRIFTHLGVATDVEFERFPYAERSFVGPGNALPDRHRALLEALFAEEIERLAARFGGPATTWRS